MSNRSTVQQLTEDHLPSLEHEFLRITKAGGFVSSGRVDGALAISRAFGDFAFKDNMMLPLASQRVTNHLKLPIFNLSYLLLLCQVVSTPDVVRVDNVGGNDLVLLCCDGIFECMSSQQVATFILEKSKVINDNAQILCELMELSLSLGSQDNMTATLIEFNNNEGDEESQQSQTQNYDEDDKGQPSATTGGLKGGEFGASASDSDEIRFGQMPCGFLFNLSEQDRLQFISAYVNFANRYCDVPCPLEALQKFSKAYKIDLVSILDSLCSKESHKPAPIW